MKKIAALVFIILLFGLSCSDDPAKQQDVSTELPGKNYILPKRITMTAFTGDFCQCTDSVTIDFTYENGKVKSIDRLVKYHTPNYPAFKDSVFEHFDFKYLDKELHIDVTDENDGLVSRGVFFFSGGEYAYPTSFNYIQYGDDIPVSQTISFTYSSDNFLRTVTRGNQIDTFYVDKGNLYYENDFMNARMSYSEITSTINQFSGFNWYGYTMWMGWESHIGPNPLLYPLKLFKASEKLSYKDVPPNPPGINNYTYEITSDTIRSIDFSRQDVDAQFWHVEFEY